MPTLTQVLATSAKMAAKFSLRFFLLAATGWLLSFVMLISLWPEWSALFSTNGQGVHSGHAGFVGAVLAFFVLFLQYPLGMGLIILFAIGFPVWYHMAAMKGAAAHTMNYLVRTHRSFLVEYPVMKCREYLEAKGMHNPTNISLTQVTEYLQKFTGMNWVSRACFRFVTNKLPLGEMIHQSISSGEVSGQQMAEQYLVEKFAQAKPKLFLVGIVVHLVLFVAVKVIY